MSGMFGKLLKSFMRQVLNIKAHNIPRKLLNISEISTMLLLNYRTKIWKKLLKTTIEGPDGQTIKKTKKLRALTMRTEKKFVRTIFLSGHFFCLDKRAITTK